MKKIQKHYTSQGRKITLEGLIKGQQFIANGDVFIHSIDGKRELTGKYINGKPVVFGKGGITMVHFNQSITISMASFMER